MEEQNGRNKFQYWNTLTGVTTACLNEADLPMEDSDPKVCKGVVVRRKRFVERWSMVRTTKKQVQRAQPKTSHRNEREELRGGDTYLRESASTHHGSSQGNGRELHVTRVLISCLLLVAVAVCLMLSIDGKL